MKTILSPTVVYLSCLLVSVLFVDAQEVSVVSGDIYIQPQPQQLTSDGRVHEAVISPDNRWIAFVRSTPEHLIPVGAGDAEASELWVMRANGSEARCLLKGKSSDNMKDVLAGFHSLQFSPNSEALYFLSSAWVTSDALHVADINSEQERFLTGGNWYKVVPSGEYAGHLLVSKHRYFFGGGSYDWIWLVTPDGGLLDPVSEGLAADDEYELFMKRGCFRCSFREF